MILELDNWHLGYAQIVKDCQVDGTEDDQQPGTVLILCNADVDAMAAARILSFMLRSDNITYQLRPCTSFSALQKVINNSSSNTNLKALVLLNLGASRNLTRLFDEHGLSISTTRVYVMDCRRPFHLANVHAGQNVVVFWDETTAAQIEDIPSDGDNLSGNESTSSEEDEDSSSDEDSNEGEEEFEDAAASEGEEEFDDGGDIVAQPRPAQEEDHGYDAEDDNEQEDDLPGAKRHKKDDFPDDSSDTTKEGDQDDDRDIAKESDDAPDDAEQADEEEDEALLDPREMHRQRRNRLRVYYSGGSFYGSPAAYVAYRLSAQLRFAEHGNLLWLACVGVTDAYLHSRLDVAGYTSLSLNLKQYCMRLYPNDMYSRLENTTYAEHLMGTSNREDNHHLTSITLSENGRVLAEQDFRFFLLRHTSLYDGMVHSNYVSTKLQLWTKKGLSHFHELLAKMGCPLEQCRQPYVFMNPKVRRSLRDKLTTFADEYGLEKFEFTCFKRVTGFNSLLSASDMSYAVTALLECDTPAIKSSPTKDGDVIEEDVEEREALQAFNIAYDALNCSSSPNMILSEGNTVSNLVNGGNLSGNTGVGAGLRLAMSLQKSIMATAVSLVDRNAITRLRHFRYAYITCTAQDGPSGKETDQHHVFAKPLALTKLAHYLMDMHRENGKWSGNKARPLVLLAEKPRTNTYLVVGYEYPERTGDFVKNRFGSNFELAAKTMKGTFRFDSFDSNVVEVDSEDVQRFIEQLHYMLDSM